MLIVSAKNPGSQKYMYCKQITVFSSSNESVISLRPSEISLAFNSAGSNTDLSK